MKQSLKYVTIAIAGLMMLMPFASHAETVAVDAEVKTDMSTNLVAGEQAPDFKLTDTNGVSHSLSDFAGKVVVLEWTNHKCPYVQKHYDSKNMQTLQKEATDDGVVWLSINSSAEGRQGYTTPDEANALIAEMGSNETARLIDASGKVGQLYHARTTPHMYVVNTDGTLVYQGAIDDRPSANPATIDGSENYVRSALANLSAGEAVVTNTTKPYGCSVKY